MNCKKGDLAIIVGTDIPEFKLHIGKIVKCVRLSNVYENSWITDPRIVHNGMLVSWHEDHLRPIRDNEKEDEMLRLIGKPETNKLKV